MVPGGDGEGAGPSQRPASPGQRPESPSERPAEPGERPAESGAETAPAEPKTKPRFDPNNVPTARADRTMTYVMFAAVILLAAGVIIGLVLAITDHTSSSTGPGNNAAANPDDPGYEYGYDDPVSKDPFKTMEGIGPAIAGDVPLVPPVVYVLDGGQVMGEIFDYTVGVSRVSVLSLKPTDKFTVIISASKEVQPGVNTPPAPLESATAKPRPAPIAKPAAEPEETAEPSADSDTDADTDDSDATPRERIGKDLYLPGGWLPGNKYSEQAFQEWVQNFQGVDVPQGQTDVLASVDAALDLRPRTVVVFTLKNLLRNDELTPEAAAVAAKAKSLGIPIIAVGLHKGLDVNEQVKQGLEKFSAASGADGQTRNYNFSQLKEWADEFFYNQ